MKSLKDKAIDWFQKFFKDPFNVDSDWESFKTMNQEQLRLEFDKLQTKSPRSDRFRRLCQYIALQWVYNGDWGDEEEKIKLFIKETKSEAS